MKKAKLVKAIFTQEEIAAINTKNIKLEEENKMLKKELGILNCKGGTPELVGHVEFVRFLIEENKKLKAELELHKKQYKHSMGEDYIDEDLYDLDC